MGSGRFPDSEKNVKKFSRNFQFHRRDPTYDIKDPKF